MTHPTPMTLQRLRALIDAYGAELTRMPEAEREAARVLIAGDTEAAQLIAQARAFDALLDTAPVEPVTAALRARVAEIPIVHPQREADPWLRWLSWRGAARLALAGAVAAAIGAASVALTVDEELLVAGDDGWDDITAVAFATGLEEEQAP
jgi:hypothetical protein